MAYSNTQSENNVSVITPCLSLGNNSINISISRQNGGNTKIIPVKYSHDGNYVLANKNGNVPDITLDRATVDLLIEARKIEQAADELTDYILAHKYLYNADILNDTKAVSEILAKCMDEHRKAHDSVIQPMLEHIIPDCKSAQKYIL